MPPLPSPEYPLSLCCERSSPSTSSSSETRSDPNAAFNTRRIAMVATGAMTATKAMPLSCTRTC